MNPQFPIYIVSKGRAASRLTVKTLDAMRVPYRVVVEEQELESYAAVIPRERLLVLDPVFQREYETCDDLGDAKTKGSGPARNFVWAHAVESGAPWHWTMDDNIRHFYRAHRNEQRPLTDGTGLRLIEDFCLQYRNVAMAGPYYKILLPKREPQRFPLILNSRVYSCNLIRTDVPFRWRGRYNEDTILSLDMLKAGWCTISFRAILSGKVATGTMSGGNDDSLYRDEKGQRDTCAKSEMLARVHPDVARVVWRYGRWHHRVDYRPFRLNRLVRRLNAPPIPDYGFRLVDVPGVVPHGWKAWQRRQMAQAGEQRA